jgi:hypothetical protein
MPDDELMASAAAGRLGNEEELRSQVRRMLEHPAASALIDNFVEQWLQLRALREQHPSTAVFPEFDDALADSMMEETRLFMRDFIRGDRPFDQLLSAPFTYVDQRLAAHYGLVTGDNPHFRQVALTGSKRGGLLTQGSILTLTSFPTRTSPVRRGKWVLEQLLCSAPPPPPPGVGGLIPPSVDAPTVRKRLEQHRADPFCYSCHSVMDPIGFGLESFDAVGRLRNEDNGHPVDASGVLPDGREFSNTAGLVQALQDDPRFVRCFVQKMFTYAIGRSPTATDQEFLDDLVARFAEAGYRVPELIEELVVSRPFRFRRGETAGDHQENPGEL